MKCSGWLKMISWWIIDNMKTQWTSWRRSEFLRDNKKSLGEVFGRWKAEVYLHYKVPCSSQYWTTGMYKCDVQQIVYDGTSIVRDHQLHYILWKNNMELVLIYLKMVLKLFIFYVVLYLPRRMFPIKSLSVIILFFSLAGNLLIVASICFCQCQEYNLFLYNNYNISDCYSLFSLCMKTLFSLWKRTSLCSCQHNSWSIHVTQSLT